MVILINPPRHIREGNVWKTINRCLPPLGLGYIAALLEKNQIPVKIFDLQAENINSKQLKNHLKNLNPQFIGLTATTIEVNSALSLIKSLKDEEIKAKFILGGPHPTIMPEEVLNSGLVDIVVRGEGERTMLEIARGKDLNTIAGISFKRDGNFVHNPDLPFIEKLDDLPFPAYHLLPMGSYRPSIGNYLRLPAMSMITSRGCPGRCSFCYTGVFGNKIRMRSPRNIIEEIKFLIKGYGIREISFYDDTFTSLKRRTEEFCQIIIDENIDVTWSCMSRVDYVEKELLKLMKKAGCHQIGYGIESGDEQILKNINKMISLDAIRRAIKETKENGIDVRAMFMFGNPGETKETLEKTLNFAIELDPDIFVFNITVPYPGTAQFNWAEENGFLKSKDWDQFDLSKVVMNLPTVDAETIETFYKTAYKKCYARPTYLLRRFSKVRSLENLRMNFRAFHSLVMGRKDN